MNTANNNGVRLLLLWYGIALVVLVLDLLTKCWVSESLALYQRINVLPVFDITLRHNYGAAFSFLADQSGWQRWALAVIAGLVSVGLIFWIAKIGRSKGLEVFGLSLILGGALGNLYDRVTLGYVVDFILVYYDSKQFPAFNIADSAITVGAGALLLDAFLLHKKGKSDNGASSSHDEVKTHD